MDTIPFDTYIYENVGILMNKLSIILFFNKNKLSI